jgi:hypothetical protein
LTCNLIGSVVLGPVLLLPMIGTAQSLSAHGKPAEAVALPGALVLLNLCLLLPLAIAVAVVFETSVNSGAGVWREALMSGSVPYSMLNWRIDAVLLTVVSAFFLPAALGRWKTGRIEGVLLVICYCVYMALELWAGTRWF